MGMCTTKQKTNKPVTSGITHVPVVYEDRFVPVIYEDRFPDSDLDEPPTDNHN